MEMRILFPVLSSPPTMRARAHRSMCHQRAAQVETFPLPFSPCCTVSWGPWGRAGPTKGLPTCEAEMTVDTRSIWTYGFLKRYRSAVTYFTACMLVSAQMI